MTKRVRIWLIALLAVICAACGFVGCSIGKPGADEILKAYNCNVTYYGNGGYFNGSNSINVKNLYFQVGDSGMPFYDIPGRSSQGLYVQNSGYNLVGWFLPATYEEGEHAGEIMYTYTPEGEQDPVPVYPVLDEDGNPVKDTTARRPVYAREGVDEKINERSVYVVPSDSQVTGETMLEKDKDIVVCARWERTLQLEYVLVYEGETPLTDAGGNVYETGDVLRSDDFTGSSTSASTSAPKTFDGVTFIGTYLDEECTTLANSPIARPEDATAAVRVYCKYMEGNWTVVTADRSSLNTMFFSLTYPDTAFYIAEDIDCSNMSAFTLPQAYADSPTLATIDGGGHTISNISFTARTGTASSQYSIFGNLASGACIKNLKFSGVSITASGRSREVSVFAFVNSAQEGAIFKAFEAENITLTLNITGGQTENIQDENSAYWLFGGFGTDQAFIERFGGENGENIRVSGDNKIIINS